MASFSAAATSLIFLLSLFISSPSVDGSSAGTHSCSVLVPTHLIGCLPFVLIGSKEDKPVASCCTGLTKLLEKNATCLCESLKSGGSMGMKVNITKAETLPAACKLTAPSCPSWNTTPPAPAPKSPHTAPAPKTPPKAPAPVPVPAPKSGPGGPNNSSPAPAPSPSHGSSLTPISGLSVVITGALVVLFSHM